MMLEQVQHDGVFGFIKSAQLKNLDKMNQFGYPWLMVNALPPPSEHTPSAAAQRPERRVQTFATSVTFSDLWTQKSQFSDIFPFSFLRAFAPWPSAKFILSACKAVEGREPDSFLFAQRRKGAKKKGVAVATLLLAALPLPASAQEHDHAAMGHVEQTSENDGPEQPLFTSTMPTSIEGSGTSRIPGGNGVMRGFHAYPGSWTVMAHGSISTQYTDHSGPRGDGKAYVTSMAMLTGERGTEWGRIQLKSMLSLEPIMSNRGYPNLFATGETAGGNPLVDRQHPHDLFMELAGRVDVDLSDKASLFLYGGPVGEPALGPSAFMHRGSAKLNPEPPITHHWFDSTHITYGVATAGYATRRLQLEASLFTGREPDEKRWNIEKPRFDSWSVRATWTPSPRWAAQVSHGRLKEPEFSTHPGENEHRTTASVHYADGQVSAMLAFAAKNRDPGETLTAWLAEANWDLGDHHTLFGRVENVRNDELFPDHLSPLHDTPFRVTKAQAGYAYRLPLGELFGLALGGSVSTYFKPDALDAAYGRNPWGYTLFARLSLGH
jgi:hypothetical protein